jgi:general L-amino acid transport system substrate-binding protein
VIKQIGNYAEMYDRNVGANSQLKIPRALNTQWNVGGMLYSPPFR